MTPPPLPEFLVEFIQDSFLKQNPDVDASTLLPDNAIEQGQGSRYIASFVSPINPENSHQEITIWISPSEKVTWFVYAPHVKVTRFTPTSSDRPERVIEFTQDSFLKQSTDTASGLLGANKIKQGKGARYEVSRILTVDSTGHLQVKLPIKPGGRETWLVFAEHVNVK